jgi:hypothetical protein
MVQVSKSEGPFSRMRLGGGGAGTCRTWIAASLVRPGEDDDPKGAEDGETERREYVFDQMEAMMSEDELQADERMCDSIDSVGTMLRKIYGSESEEDGEETMEAKEQIVRVTEQIASGGTGDSGSRN